MSVGAFGLGPSPHLHRRRFWLHRYLSPGPLSWLHFAQTWSRGAGVLGRPWQDHHHDAQPHSADLPLNIGASFHTPRPPMDVYWPREHSSRKSGTPAKMSVRKYGIRKAPARWRRDACGPTALEKPWSDRPARQGALGSQPRFPYPLPQRQHHSHREAQGCPMLKTHPVHFANEEVNFLMSLTEDNRPLGITLVKGQETGSGA